MLKFLLEHNLLPYIALAVAGYWIYALIGANIKTNIKLDNAKASTHLANENMGILVEYTDRKFSELQKLKSEEWKKGKHEKTIYYIK